MKCFECGDVGHKRLDFPHREQAERAENHIVQTHEADGQGGAASSSMSTVQGERMHSVENTGTNQDGKVDDSSSEPSTSAESAVAPPKEVKITGEQISEVEATEKSVPTDQNAFVASAENEVTTLLNVGSQVESDAEEMEQDESDGEGFDGSNRVKDLYSLEEINNFLDETFGQSVKVDDYFADTDKFIRSVALLQKMVSLDLLDERKRYRLRKHVTALKKVSKPNKTGKGRRASVRK